MGGKVVRALRGERHAYQPLQSRLCSSAEPLEVTQALLGLYPFKTLYIADLDAIQQRGNHLSTLIELRETYPDIEIWVDAGIKHPDEALALKNHGFCCVVASESLPNLSTAHAVLETLDSEHAILSLDFVQGQFKGPAELLGTPSLWPQRVIGMNLAKVGSYEGPDNTLLQQLVAEAPGRDIFAAGGARHEQDMASLKAAGVAGALVASALHDKLIKADDFLVCVQICK